jgi:hypothetical protein
MNTTATLTYLARRENFQKRLAQLKAQAGAMGNDHQLAAIRDVDAMLKDADRAVGMEVEPTQ